MKKVALAVMTVFLSAGPYAAQAEEAPPPSQLTSRGNIAWQATEAYKEAIDTCYHGQPGNAPQGPKYLACLKQLLGKESASLDAVYAGTASALKSAPSRIAMLRQSQRAWLQFQESNCAFAKAVAGESGEEFFVDCMLRSTIERRVELRSLVGD